MTKLKLGACTQVSVAYYEHYCMCVTCVLHVHYMCAACVLHVCYMCTYLELYEGAVVDVVLYYFTCGFQE